MSPELEEAIANWKPTPGRAYDPNNLHPLDAEAKKYDDTSEGIDWDEIIATTQDDYLAGRFAFNSADYPNHEAAMVALEKWVDDIYQEVMRERAGLSALDAPGSEGYEGVSELCGQSAVGKGP